MERFRNSEKGFTLVELLIVVAIIGILAAIAIPQFTKYKKNAVISQCESDLKNCMSEVAAQFALTGAYSSDGNGSEECSNLAGNKFNDNADYLFEINPSDGEITVNGNSSTEETDLWTGYTVIVDINDNRANCTIE